MNVLVLCMHGELTWRNHVMGATTVANSQLLVQPILLLGNSWDFSYNEVILPRKPC